MLLLLLLLPTPPTFLGPCCCCCCCPPPAGCHVEMRTLDTLLHVKMPKLHKHLQDLGCDVSILSTDWFLCLFCTTLPIPR